MRPTGGWDTGKKVNGTRRRIAAAPLGNQGEPSVRTRDLLQRTPKSGSICVVAWHGHDELRAVARCCDGSDPRPVPRYDADPSPLADEVMHNPVSMPVPPTTKAGLLESAIGAHSFAADR
ncbi:hypothetical protein GA0115234_104120 [Streptomyces sp. DvalAA-43]|nr:hypothetical protein GA0115234_104120 [Streptomyces sp. DvalAA-43]